MFGPPLAGKLVSLVPPTLEAILLFPTWIADPQVRRYLLVQEIYSEGQQREYYEHAARNSDAYMWSIITQEGDGARVIGSVALQQIDWRNRRCISGTIIGESAYWGRGIATEVMALRTRYAFAELGLEKVMTEIFLDNTASWHAAMRSGYQQIGVRRHHIFRDGRWHDMWVGEVLRDDWLAAQAHDDTLNQ